MADRYWVGGTGTWSSSNTTNWAATSGGAGGESVPTALDNVFFDAGSDSGGTFVVTMANSPRVCNDITISGLDFGMTLAGFSVGLTVSGSLSFPATNFTRTYTGTTTFNATTTGKIVTTNGVVFGGSIDFNGAGGGWTLGSNLSVGTSNILLTQGSLNTSVSNYSITAGIFFSSNTLTRNLTLNGSTVNVSGFNSWQLGTTTNMTFDAGTSTINFAGNIQQTFNTGGFNYYNLTTNSPPNISGTRLIIQGSAVTFNNFSVVTSVDSQTVDLRVDVTINGTFTCNGSAGNLRSFIEGNAGRTLTCANIAAMNDVDFRNITLAGAASPLSGTRLGDCGGNSGIVFAAAKTVYWNDANGGNWYDNNAWAATSGGATSNDNFPLPQDTAVIENTGLDSGATILQGASYDARIGTLDMSSRTNAMTFNFFATFANTYFFGNLALGSGVTRSGSGSIVFVNSTTRTFDSAGKTFDNPITISGSGTALQLINNNLTNGSTRNISVGTGTTLDLNGLDLSTGTMSTGSGTITFNTGNITITGSGSTAWNNLGGAGLTTAAGTGAGTITMTSASAKTFVGGGATYAASLIQGGAGTLTITESNTFEDITNSTQPSTILFTGSTTQTVGDFTLSGTSGNLITIDSTTASPFTLSKLSGNVSVSFLDIQDSAATGGADWIALDANGNVDSGNNTGWVFSSGGTGNMLMMFF
jgi:hypothetical protein